MTAWPTLEGAAAALRDGSGHGVRIAVLDSGIEAAHPALNGIALADDLALVPRPDGTLEEIPGQATDVFGHGTAVASIIRELAPSATLGSFRVLGGALTSRTATIAEGVRIALARGYHILNCSFACRGDARHLAPFKSWVDAAYLQGCHVVAACSNAGSALPEWPAHFTSVIGVDFCACPGGQLVYRPGEMVAFAARGANVTVPWKEGSYNNQTGSSYAAPQVTGLLARLLSVYPQTSAPLAKELLARSATPP